MLIWDEQYGCQFSDREITYVNRLSQFCSMCSSLLTQTSMPFDTVRSYRKYSVLMTVCLCLLTVFRCHTEFTVNNSVEYPQVMHAKKLCSNSSSSTTDQYTSNCPNKNLSTGISIRQNELVDRISVVLQSHSLMYCPVPKIATKMLLNVMLFMHVRDMIEHLNNNWTNIEAHKAQIEKMIDVPKFIDDLRSVCSVNTRVTENFLVSLCRIKSTFLRQKHRSHFQHFFKCILIFFNSVKSTQHLLLDQWILGD